MRRYPTLEETSIPAIVLNRCEQHRDRVILKALYRDGRFTNRWESYTWGDKADEMEALTAAWTALGCRPQQRVAVLGKNRPRWIFSVLSLFMADQTFVAVYPTLTGEEIAFLLRDSGARFLVCDTREQVDKVLPHFDDLPALEKIFVMDPIGPSDDPRVGSYEELRDLGRQHLDRQAMLERIQGLDAADSVAALIYTSGTTGRPKGVMLTQANFISQRVVLPQFELGPDDIFLNHLPFCHSFGLTADLMGCADVAGTLVIGEGIQPEQIRRGLTEIRPTVLMSVPRLFEKMYLEVQRVVSGRPKKVQGLFQGALDVGKQVFDLRNEGRRIPLGLQVKFKAATVVLNKVRTQAGLDRVRIAYAGGGPTSRELCTFFQSLGIDIYQGYGLTETSPIANVNVPGKNKLGTVGPPMQGVEEKLADDGEILIRGPNVMLGYHNLPEATAEAIDGEGWFHTGDIGEFDADGYLKITDRKKEIIVTSGGKNIAPLAIESAFNTEALIEQLVVIGDDRKYLTALVCPNFEALRRWADAEGLAAGSDAELAALPEVKALLEARVQAVNQQFPRFSQIKKVAVMDHEFSEQTGELTPTQKFKRRVIAEMYAAPIDALYPKGDGLS